MPTTSSSPWTRPPQQPARYWLGARLSDMLHGWLDGRHGIPQLPQDMSPAVNGAIVPAAEIHLTTVANLPTVPEAASPAPQLRTPRMDVLASQARQLIAEEEHRLEDDRAVLQRESAHFLQSLDALTRQVTVTEEQLKQARNPLSDEERGNRRLAEQDAKCRPAGLVRARRETAWERRLSAAEQRHQSVTARLAEATRGAQLREELIRDREAVARAAARRHHEFALRRIATYLQQLVRTHPRGADLNRLLILYPVGPELPEWTNDPAPGPSGTERMPAEGNAPITHDSDLQNEASAL